MNLSLVMEHRARVRVREDVIDERLGDLVLNRFVWPGRTRLSKIIERHQSVDLKASVHDSRVPTIEASAKKFITRFGMQSGSLRLHKTENERIAVGRIEGDVILDFGMDKATALRSLGWKLRRAIRSVERDLGLVPNAILSDAVRSTQMYAAMRQLLASTRPRSVVVAATDHLFTRVAAVVARERGIPTIYVPHAPTHIRQENADAPFDALLLRGSGCSSYYAMLGAKDEQVASVGDRSIPEIRLGGEPIGLLFATTANAPCEDLTEKLQLTSRALNIPSEQILICPHPRGRSRALHAGKSLGIAVAEERTAQVLLRLDPQYFVTEASSGARLEAELMGIATLSLAAPSYNFEFTLPSLSLDTCDDQALEGLEGQVSQLPKIERSRRASMWVAAVGREASERVEQGVEEVGFASHPALDAWGFFN